MYPDLIFNFWKIRITVVISGAKIFVYLIETVADKNAIVDILVARLLNNDYQSKIKTTSNLIVLNQNRKGEAKPTDYYYFFYLINTKQNYNELKTYKGELE